MSSTSGLEQDIYHLSSFLQEIATIENFSSHILPDLAIIHPLTGKTAIQKTRLLKIKSKRF